MMRKRIDDDMVVFEFVLASDTQQCVSSGQVSQDKSCCRKHSPRLSCNSHKGGYC